MHPINIVISLAAVALVIVFALLPTDAQQVIGVVVGVIVFDCLVCFGLPAIIHRDTEDSFLALARRELKKK